MTLIAIGGAEDKTGDMEVLKTVLDAAKGADSRVHVITTATNYPEDAEKTYRDAFKRLGVDCAVTHIATTEQANDPALLKDIAQADVVFFSGGDQSKLSDVLNGTDFLETVKTLHTAGGVVAGTSAGAAIMADIMMAGGDPEQADRKGDIKTGTGFALQPEAIFDTHFLNRNRLSRLFNLVAVHPDKTGIGLDEDTAAIIRDNGEIEVVGSGAVTVVEGGTLKDNNAPGAKDGEKITAHGFTVTTLRRGDSFRL